MKKITIIANDGIEGIYLTNDKWILCKTFVKAILRRTPKKIKITVADYRLHRSKKFSFSDATHAHTKSYVPFKGEYVNQMDILICSVRRLLI